MADLLETVRETLVSALVEQWYYGLALDFIALLVFFILLEELHKAFGRLVTAVVSLAGLGLYVGLIASLIGSYTGFSIGLIVIGGMMLYFAYFAYFGKKKKKKSEKSEKGEKSEKD